MGVLVPARMGRERSLWVVLVVSPVAAIADTAVAFTVAHYNILASYAANNRNPWFLMPLNLSSQERAAIMARYYEREASGGYRYRFVDGYGGLLTPAQVEEVRVNDIGFKWDVRGPKLLREVQRLDADVLSLVEMDRFEEFRQVLAPTHASAFTKRPRARSSDGSSLFWRRDRFEAIGAPINVTFEDWEPRQAEVHHEDRVMLAVALRDRLDGRVSVVASVHLMRNPEDVGKDPMRMLEVSQMMQALSCFVADVGAAGLIVMGDFNAVPESWTHTFMLHGWQDCADSAKGMRGAFDAIKWGSPDACTPVCTTKTLARCMWVDYIFYSGRTLELHGQPHIDPCPKGPMPDEQHPSDHLPLRASFRFAAGARELAARARSGGCTHVAAAAKADRESNAEGVLPEL